MILAGFEHLPGVHCGSAALADALRPAASRSPSRWRSASARGLASTTSSRRSCLPPACSRAAPPISSSPRARCSGRRRESARLLYARFLEEAEAAVPRLAPLGLSRRMRALAEAWSRLAAAFRAVSEVPGGLVLPLQGAGFPGHFLSKYTSANGTEIFVDAFNGGEMLSADECVARYRARTGGRELDRRHLEAVAPRQILARMLHNLKRTYLERRDDVRAYWVLDRILLLAPGQLEALRERGLVSARLGVPAAAESDLEGYLARAPAAGDAAEVRRVLAALRGRRPLVN